MKQFLAIVMTMLVVSAFAAETDHNWFDAGIANIGITRTWPTDGSDYAGYLCTVTNTENGTYQNGAIAFDAETPMSVCPYAGDDQAPNPANVGTARGVGVSMSLKMVPFDVSDIPDVPDAAAAGVIAVADGETTNFWVVAGTEDRYWTNTTIAADTAKTLEVSVLVGTNATDGTFTEWTLDGKLFSCGVNPVEAVHDVSFLGKGECFACYGDTGLEDGWMVVTSDNGKNYLVKGRYPSLAAAILGLKDGFELLGGSSAATHVFGYGEDGATLTVDGVPVSTKAHYHFVKHEYSDGNGGTLAYPSVAINSEEADITSIGEDASDSDRMLIGTISDSVENFYYSVIYGDDLKLEDNSGETVSVVGNGGKLSLSAPKGDGGKRFYRIHVSDIQQ